MSIRYPALREQDVEALAWLASDSRAHPERYGAGSALLEDRFSPAAMLAKRRERVRAIRQEEGLEPEQQHAPGGRAIERLRRAEHAAMEVTTAECVREALDWLAEAPEVMWEKQAESFGLLMAALWDETPQPNPALPVWLRDVPRDPPELLEVRGFMLRREIDRTRPRLAATVARLRPEAGRIGQGATGAGASSAPPDAHADGRGHGPHRPGVPEADTEARLLALIIQDPSLTVAEYAKLAGVSRSTPYRYPRVKGALKARAVRFDELNAQQSRGTSHGATADETDE